MNFGAGLFIFRVCLCGCVGLYKYYSHATDNTGVFLNTGAEFDLALSGGGDAYLSARQWVGINASPACQTLSQQNQAIIGVNKGTSRLATTVSPALTLLRSTGMMPSA